MTARLSPPTPADALSRRLDRVHELVGGVLRKVDPETRHTLANAMCILEYAKDDAIRLEDRAADGPHPTPPDGRESASAVSVEGLPAEPHR